MGSIRDSSGSEVPHDSGEGQSPQGGETSTKSPAACDTQSHTAKAILGPIQTRTLSQDQVDEHRAREEAAKSFSATDTKKFFGSGESPVDAPTDPSFATDDPARGSSRPPKDAPIGPRDPPRGPRWWPGDQQHVKPGSRDDHEYEHVVLETSAFFIPCAKPAESQTMTAASSSDDSERRRSHGWYFNTRTSQFEKREPTNDSTLS